MTESFWLTKSIKLGTFVLRDMTGTFVPATCYNETDTDSAPVSVSKKKPRLLAPTRLLHHGSVLLLSLSNVFSNNLHHID